MSGFDLVTGVHVSMCVSLNNPITELIHSMKNGRITTHCHHCSQRWGSRTVQHRPSPWATWDLYILGWRCRQVGEWFFFNNRKWSMLYKIKRMEKDHRDEGWLVVSFHEIHPLFHLVREMCWLQGPPSKVCTLAWPFGDQFLTTHWSHFHGWRNDCSGWFSPCVCDFPCC